MLTIGTFRAISTLCGRVRATSPRARHRAETLDPSVEAEIILFLRGWLPESVKEEYRRMIDANPAGWHRQPHFRDRIVVLHLLRGNGISEASLGIRSFDAIWPKLLRKAVELPPVDGER